MTRFYNYVDHSAGYVLDVIWGANKEEACLHHKRPNDDRVQGFPTPKYFGVDNFKRLIPMLAKWEVNYIWSVTLLPAKNNFDNDRLVIVCSQRDDCNFVLTLNLERDEITTIWNHHVLEDFDEDGDFKYDPTPEYYESKRLR